MKAIFARIRADFAFWGGRLNALQALIVAAIVANADKLQPAIALIVPAKLQGATGLIAGIVSYLIVNIAAQSDRKKAGVNG